MNPIWRRSRSEVLSVRAFVRVRVRLSVCVWRSGCLIQLLVGCSLLQERETNTKQQQPLHSREKERETEAATEAAARLSQSRRGRVRKRKERVRENSVSCRSFLDSALFCSVEVSVSRERERERERKEAKRESDQESVRHFKYNRETKLKGLNKRLNREGGGGHGENN
jgi:hypothetical protein